MHDKVNILTEGWRTAGACRGLNRIGLTFLMKVGEQPEHLEDCAMCMIRLIFSLKVGGQPEH